MAIDSSDSNAQLSRREREKLRHRGEIIEAATRVFSEKGFHSATLDEVAQKAEFSKGAIYLYFSSKEDLLYSIITDKMVPFRDLVATELERDLPLKEILRNLLEQMAEFAFRERDFFKLVMTLHANEYGLFSEEKACEFKAGHEEFWGRFRDVVVKAETKGELRQVNPEAIIGIVHGAVESMMMSRWGCEDVDCLKNAVNSFIEILFNGIAKEREISE